MALVIVWEDLSINSIIQVFSVEENTSEERATRSWMPPQTNSRILQVVLGQHIVGKKKKKNKKKLD